MSMHVTDIRPEPKLLSADALPPLKRFSTKRALDVLPAECCIVRQGDRFEAHAPSGSDWLRLELKTDATALVFQRETELYLTVKDCRFANSRGNEGEAALWTRIRLIPGDSLDHPLLGRLRSELSQDAFRNALAQALESSIGAMLEEQLGAFTYTPLCQDALTQHLSSFHELQPVCEAAHRRAGMLFTGPFMALAVAAPSLDAPARLAEIKRIREQERRTRLEQALADAAAQAAQSRIAHEQALQNRRQHLERELQELEARKSHEEIRVAIELTRRKAEEEARAVKAEADRKAAEALLSERQAALAETQIEAARRELALKEQAAREAREAAERAARQLDGMDARLREYAAGVHEEIDAVNEKLAVLQETLDQLKARDAAPPDKALSLIAEWRAYDRDGVILPCMGAAERLPTRTMLDVAVTVSRDAFVYVLLKDASGEWLSLVPDARDLMGVRRDNRQRAGEAVVWPGVNRRCPDLPYWMLDQHRGYERFVVLASIEPLDPLAAIREDAEAALRSWTRGVCNPVELLAPPDQPPIAAAYERALHVLKGAGRIARELVVHHI